MDDCWWLVCIVCSLDWEFGLGRVLFVHMHSLWRSSLRLFSPLILSLRVIGTEHIHHIHCGRCEVGDEGGDGDGRIRWYSVLGRVVLVR